MGRQGSTDGYREAATEADVNGHSFLRVSRLAVLPSHAHLRETVDGVDVAVRIPGRGTFLIRERKDHPRSHCPFLRRDVRHMAADSPERRVSPRADPPPVCTAEHDRRRTPFGHEPSAGSLHPHWKFALQLAGDPLGKSTPREPE